jgi:type IV pilus assembly protein PilW
MNMNSNMNTQGTNGVAGRESGLTLIELMIAMVLGVIVLGAIFYSYIGSRSSYRLNDEIARMQENGRVAVDMLERDLRMAGYAGCRGAGRVLTRSDAALETIKAELGVGVFATQNAALLGGEAYALRVLAPSAPDARLAADVTAGSAQAKLEQNTGRASVGDYVLIHDCSNGELFRVNGLVAASGGGLDLTLDAVPSRPVKKDNDGMAFTLPKTASGLAGVVYEVEVPSGGSLGVLRRNGEELLGGVEAFRVCLAKSNVLDADSGRWKNEVDSGGYRRAELVTGAEREKVIAVQVDLLLASVSDTALENDTEQTFELCGDGATPTPITKNDRRLRKQFSATISLRNKLR